MAIRLNKVMKYFGVSMNAVTHVLKKKGLPIENAIPSTKITTEQFKVLFDLFGEGDFEEALSTFHVKPSTQNEPDDIEDNPYNDLIKENDSPKIIGEPEITILLKYRQHVADSFDAANNTLRFSTIVEELVSNLHKCFLIRKTSDLYGIIIPMQNFGGILEIAATYTNYCLEIRVKNRTKTRFVKESDYMNTEMSISKLCAFQILFEKEMPEPEFISPLSELIKELNNIPIYKFNNVTSERKIWSHYITAQDYLYRKLAEPFDCHGTPIIKAITSVDGNEISRYEVEFEIKSEKSDEFRILEKKLQDDFNINADIDSDGQCLLTQKEIKRWVDPLLNKEFRKSIAREDEIGCILPIRPFYNEEKLQDIIGDDVRFVRNGKHIEAHNVIIDEEELIGKMDSLGYHAIGRGAHFTVNNKIDLTKHVNTNKYNVTFDNGKAKYQLDKNVKELFLPMPIDNTFSIIKKKSIDIDILEESSLLRETLIMLYGKENIVEDYSVMFISEEFNEYARSMKADSLLEIERDLKLLDFVQTSFDLDKKTTIYFSFRTENELKEKFEKIQSLNSFKIERSPYDEDFRFKVRFNVVSTKSLLQRFRDKLDKLAGEEFVVDVSNSDDKTKPVFVGKLNAKVSSANKLVLYLPNRKDEDKKRVREFLNLIDDNYQFKSIHADLRGDQAKLEWLVATMDKINDENERWSPDYKPVNDKIKDFIFDSSLVRPTQKLENRNIHSMPEFKDFDKTSILSLNDSQKEAVVKGLDAQDMCLLQGPPGTGKTTVIAELIWQHIRRNQDSKLLLTSETNLAVDNAIEKLMNGGATNPELSNYITMIRPIRFGKSAKFEDEGKRYSIERIEKWVDEEAVVEDEYEDGKTLDEISEEDFDEDDIIIKKENYADNVVQHWMSKIGSRAQHENKKYSNVLKDWAWGLEMPDKGTKEMFKNIYYKHVNVIGSTCSSTGSPGFRKEYHNTFNSMTKEKYKALSSVVSQLNKPEPKWRTLRDSLNTLGIHDVFFEEYDADQIKQQIWQKYAVKFDTVIMDEASKALPPELLLPLCFGHKAIVIGDHRQLPPMLNERSFRESLLDLEDSEAEKMADEIDQEFVDTSQFKRLILNPRISPTVKATFNVQYRMHPHINNVINQFYINDESNGLVCGLDNRYVDSIDMGNPNSRYHGLSFDGFITPDIHTLWINVDAPEMQEGTSRINEAEVDAVKNILTVLKKSQGFNQYMDFWDKADFIPKHKRNEEKEIGVISFYGKQVSLLRRSIRPNAIQMNIPIRLNTVDKFQGMERNIVIVSTVRSNFIKTSYGIEINDDIGFAKSPERLNVALSRARRLLIVVGNMDFFSEFKDKEGRYLYRNAINEIKRHGRIISYDTIKELAKTV